MAKIENGQYCIVVRIYEPSGEVKELPRGMLWYKNGSVKFCFNLATKIFFEAKICPLSFKGKECLKIVIKGFKEGAVFFFENNAWHLGYVDDQQELTVNGRLVASPELVAILEDFKKVFGTV